MGLFESIIPDQAFWIICALFYLTDNIKLLRERELILVEDVCHRWRLVRPLLTYSLGRGGLSLLPILNPSAAAVRMRWLLENPFSSSSMRRTQRMLRIYSRRLGAFRVLSTVLFLTLFAAGPIATEYGGLGYAIIAVLPIHLGAVACLLLLSGKLRKSWQLSWAAIFKIVLECALCPGFFVNICRRISLACPGIPGDGMAFIIMNCRGDRTQSVRFCLESYVDYVDAAGDLDSADPLTIEAYRTRIGEIARDG